MAVYGVRGPTPCYQDCVSSPALGILAVPGESAGRGLGPISSSLAQCFHPWEQGERVPSCQIPSWRGLLAACLQMQSMLVPPGCLAPTAPAPTMLLLLLLQVTPCHLLREGSLTFLPETAPNLSPSSTALIEFFIARITVWNCLFHSVSCGFSASSHICPTDSCVSSCLAWFSHMIRAKKKFLE